jgi:thymidine kinase
MGSLEVIIGPMFSGKTTELMRRIKRHMVIGHNPLIINSIKDTRCDSEIKSHDNCVLTAIKLSQLSELNSNPKVNLADYQVVAIDESQFFPDLIEYVTEVLIKKHGLHIIATGLNGDFKQQLFGDTLLLIPHAEKVDLLHGLCTMCSDGTDGCYSARIIQSDTQTLVGGKESYNCVCRKHLNILNGY